MARKAFKERRKKIVDQIAKMLVRHIQDKIYKGLGTKDIAQRSGLTHAALNAPLWTDIPEICDRAGLDIGLTIRDHKGNEVTFWPEENLSTGTRFTSNAEKKALSPVVGNPVLPRPGQRKVSSR